MWEQGGRRVTVLELAEGPGASAAAVQPGDRWPTLGREAEQPAGPGPQQAHWRVPSVVCEWSEAGPGASGACLSRAPRLGPSLPSEPVQWGNNCHFNCKKLKANGAHHLLFFIEVKLM